MCNKILDEIEDFKMSVNKGGITLDHYFKKSKQIKNKIDYESEKSMRFFRYLYFLDMISQEQYLKMKNKVDKSRKYYKSLLVI